MIILTNDDQLFLDLSGVISLQVQESVTRDVYHLWIGFSGRMPHSAQISRKMIIAEGSYAEMHHYKTCLINHIRQCATLSQLVIHTEDVWAMVRERLAEEQGE